MNNEKWLAIYIYVVTYLTINIQFATTEMKTNILLVTAHPDDETMFFLPTIKSLNPKLKIHLLCLSKGGKDGVRTNELVSSAEFLGISKLKISETNYFVDGLKEKWPHSKIRKTVEDYITKNGIKNVITFDENGVSNHPNHIDIFKAISKSDFFVENKVSLFKLKTVNSLQKYIFFIEFPFTILSKLWNFDEDNFTDFFVFNGVKDCALSMRIHNSQFSWYRKLYVLFSRYCWINEYIKVF